MFWLILLLSLSFIASSSGTATDSRVLISLNIKDIFTEAVQGVFNQVSGNDKLWGQEHFPPGSAAQKILERWKRDPDLKKKLIDSAIEDKMPKDLDHTLRASKINDWSDFYHYLPYLAPQIRIWKLKFKEEMKEYEPEFEDCVNPASLVDALIPDVEEVRKYDRFHGKNLNRSYHRLRKL
jgi:hypothetical protein